MAKVNGKKIIEKAEQTKEAVVEKAKDLKNQLENIDYTKMLSVAMKTPGVAVKREQYLRKELIKYCDEETIKVAIEHNPAYAGISRDTVNKIADNAIKLERRKATGSSIAISVPSNLSPAIAVPADIAQYFVFLVRVIQKLAYLYGFSDMNISNENEVDDETMSEVLMFIAVANGTKGASKIVTEIANDISKNIAKNLAKQPLTKGYAYPLFKTVAKKMLGKDVVKQSFADSLANLVPFAGAGLSGVVTYVFFTPCCKRLKKVLSEMNLSDPNFYKNVEV